MASVVDDTVHKQSFSIDDLAARSVTIYPTRAAVVRDIENVVIEPGRNEITLHNLTPQADEHSIKVEGHGTTALITDMTVDLIPNYRYNDASDASDSDSDSDSPPPVDAALEQLGREIKRLRLQLDDADESRSSATKQLNYLDQLTATLSQSVRDAGSVTSVHVMSENLDSYSEHREKIYGAFKVAQAICVQLSEELAEKQAKQLKLQTAWDRTLQRASRSKEQRARQKMHERQERQEQQLEVPRFVYRVRITIESGSLPEATRAVTASVATGKPARKDDDEEDEEDDDEDDDDAPPPSAKGPSLRISYITGGASWTPRYDLRLDTISGTGVLMYRAHFFNRTGEIWRNAKLTLSTSQTSFGGLEDKVPWLDSWRIALRRRGTYGAEKDGGMYSRKERELREEKTKKRKEELDREADKKLVIQENIARLAPQSRSNSLRKTANVPSPPPPPALAKFGQPHNWSGGGGDRSVRVSSGLLGSAPMPPLEVQSAVVVATEEIETSARMTKSKRRSWISIPSSVRNLRSGPEPVLPSSVDSPYDSSSSDDDDDNNDNNGDDTATLNPPQKLGLAASTPESYGLTTTYDLPGTRTIPPSKLLRRHLISSIPLPHIEFSHISVPKLRAAAFLKARIRNPSTTPLLRGPAGLTLDASFLGNATIPRCAPDDYFELSLGVDEEVRIDYRRPVRRTARQGVLVKEHVATYERCARIHNARAGRVRLVVFDQVPVSEDEKLRITVTRPRGLKAGGDAVRIPGAGAVTGAAAGTGGGCVQAEMRKGGEVRWEVEVEGGKDAVLVLEYEARLPGGEVIVGL